MAHGLNLSLHFEFAAIERLRVRGERERERERVREGGRKEERERGRGGENKTTIHHRMVVNFTTVIHQWDSREIELVTYLSALQTLSFTLSGWRSSGISLLH